jgi:hypothetical protein
MLTKTDTIKRSGAWILVPAVALITATACGGVEQDHPAGVEQGPPDAHEVQLNPPQQAAHAQLDPGARPQLPTPAYVEEQVLELCNGGAMVVKNDDVLAKRLAGDLTVELWLRVESTENSLQQIMSADGLTVAIARGRILVELSEKVLLGPALASDTWYHVALVVKGNQALLFTNGIPSARLDVHNRQTPRGPVVFGGDTGRGRPFCGKLDNVRVTPQALYLGHFTPDKQMKLLDSMVLGYDFDDLLGSKVEDLGGNGYHARLSGEASLVPGTI